METESTDGAQDRIALRILGRQTYPGSRLPCAFFDNRSRILVITQSSKLCMAQMVDLRFTLHLFMT